MTDSVEIDEAEVDAAVAVIRTEATATGARSGDTGIDGLGVAVQEAGAAAAAHWAEEFRVAAEGLRQLAQEIDDDLAAFAALDQHLLRPAATRAGGRRAEAV